MFWKPRPHQKKCMKFMLQHGAGGIFLDPGLGKTSITLGTFNILHKQNMSRGMLVVAPLRPCYLVWPAEVEKWDDFSHLSVGILHGPNKDAILREKHDIYVINPEGLEWLLTPRNMRLLDVDILVIDESTKFKHTDTRRFQNLKPWLPKFNRRYILTGTPAPNGYLDLFGQIYILDLGHALGGFITYYREKFFVSEGPFGWTPKPDAKERINKIIKPMVIRMAAEDYIELPDLMDQTIEVQLPPKIRQTYLTMERLLLAQMDSGKRIDAANVGVATGKCRQIANGGIFYSDMGVKKQGFEHLHDAKTEALLDLLEESSGQPMMVLYEFAHDLERIKQALKKGFGDVPHIGGGGVRGSKLKALTDGWNRGEVPVLLANPQSVALGLNLQSGGPHLCWYSIPWDLEVYDQTTCRLRRQGATHETIFRHHLIAKGTIDEVVMEVLREKDRTQAALLHALDDRKKGKALAP